MVKSKYRNRGKSNPVISHEEIDTNILEFIKLNKKKVSITHYAKTNNIHVCTLRKALSGENNSQNAIKLRLEFVQHVVKSSKQTMELSKQTLKMIQNAD